MKVALSVAGSDSGAGAGIQVDLKTFSALGIYGCTAITAITAQNTRQVAEISEIPPDMIRAQIMSVRSDSPPNAIKIGMTYSRQIIRAISDALKNVKAPIVLDPILAAGTGAKLLRGDAVADFVAKLIPLCTLITPNRMEAEKLSGVAIKSEKDVIKAAEKIRALGAKNVIIKGGHFSKAVVTDLLLDSRGKQTKISNPRVDIEESHGSGCNFSAAATAYLARGVALEESCRMANEYVHAAIKNTVRIGRGLPITNPLSAIYKDAMRYRVILELQQAVDRLAAQKGFYKLIPETQTNFVHALADAADHAEVAGVTGRMVKAGEHVIPVSRIEFGASRHMANAILAYMSVDPATRSVINIRFEQEILEICKSLFAVSSYNRSREPRSVKQKEGSTISWGTKDALARKPHADVIYHRGDVGKEPMITVFGRNPGDVAGKIELIINKY